MAKSPLNVSPSDARRSIRVRTFLQARISYGGRGDLSDVQKTPAGTALLQHFAPF